jgi:hypothetical protein
MHVRVSGTVRQGSRRVLKGAGARGTRAMTIALLGVSAALAPMGAAGQLRYDFDYPTIPYSKAKPGDRVTRLWDEIAAGRITLEHEGERGYLASLLKALEVPVESQALVFTRTSLQKTLISPRTPRAIYFGDDVYVAWIPATQSIEIASVDPLLGAVFYMVKQEQTARPQLERQTALCLQCHDTYGLTGGGVPELLTGAMLPDAQGNSVYHEGWFETTHETPLQRRWGGWYVTGTHGDQVHQGNVFVEDPARAATIDFRQSGNVTDLTGRLETGRYLTPHSDIVALMVFEHQILVQNLIIRLNYRLRTALNTAGLRPDATGTPSAAIADVLEREGEPLVRALLFSGEARLTAPIRGTSGFTERFAAQGPKDPMGRSLRDFDLQRRMFRYPLSYLIYSDAFTTLPEMGKAYVYRRIGEVLKGEDRSEAFSHLSEDDRRATLEIFEATRERRGGL